MRIVVANLTSGGLSGGYRKYLARLMPLLAGDRRVRRLTVFVPDSATGAIDPAVEVRAWSPADARHGYVGLRREVEQIHPDVVFVPTARYSSFGAVPVVTMVRNMEPLAVPFGGNSWKEGLKNVARAFEARRACRRARRVIAVSGHVREFVIARWHVDPARVGTVHHGVDLPPGPGGGFDRTSRALFTAGSIRPARGLEDVIRALALLDHDVRLVVAGRVDPGCSSYAERLRRLASGLRVADRVTWAGELAPDQMAGAFREHGVFVMTSRTEACPNTLLEAMASGCAIVSVDHGPMPELLAEDALYYSAGDVQALAARVQMILASPLDRERLAQGAAARAARFSWEATRDRTIAELEQALT